MGQLSVRWIDDEPTRGTSSGIEQLYNAQCRQDHPEAGEFPVKKRDLPHGNVEQ
jgi:hypothetical protein